MSHYKTPYPRVSLKNTLTPRVPDPEGGWVEQKDTVDENFLAWRNVPQINSVKSNHHRIPSIIV